jgi:hypothetical protein
LPAIIIKYDELGCILNPARTAEIIQERTERGDAVMSSVYCATVQPSLAGYWALLKSQGVTGVFLRDAELVVLGGKHRRPFFQKRGTCVARGFCRGAQSSLDFDIAYRFGLSSPVDLAFAQIYSDARHLGGDVISGDGAIPAEAAKKLFDLGVAPASLFAGMSEDEQEIEAVKFAAQRMKTPDAWRQAAAPHTVDTFWPETMPSISDCLAAGYAVPYAGNYVTGMPDKNGLADIGSYGSHQRYLSGVYVDYNGNDQWVSCESWGSFPARQPHTEDSTMPVEEMPCVSIRYVNNKGEQIIKQLAPGETGINAKKFYDMVRQGGEAWAVGVARGFVPERPENPAAKNIA